MKRTVWFLVLSVFLAAARLSASGGQEGGGAGEGGPGGELVLLNWLGGSEREPIIELEEAFMAKYPGITIKDVNTAAGGGDARSGIKTALLAGDKFDLILNTWPSLEAELREQNMLKSMDEYWDAYGWSKYLSDSWRELGSKDGKTWSVYFLAGNRSGLWYSDEAFARAGIEGRPETWDAFVEANEKLKSAGFVPIALGAKKWAQTEWFENLILKLGGTRASADLAAHKIAWNDPVVLEVFSYWQELLEKGFFDDAETMFSNHWDSAQDAVLRQKSAGFTLIGSWFSNRAYGEYGLEPGKDYNFLPFPSVKEAYADTMSIDGKSWVMMADAKNPDAAALFLDFILSAEGSAILAKHKMMTPSSSADLAAYDPTAQMSTELFASSQVFFVMDDMLPAEMSAEFRSGLQAFLADPSDANIKAVCDKLEERAAAIYK